jgi:hypothetical protein
MKWPFGGNGAAVAELEPEPEIEIIDDSKPRLMMLAADASGLASFKLLTFPTAETAIEFIQRSFGDRSDTGLIAFWAMTEKPIVSPQPGADTALEVMVMVRDDIRNDVVYPFSFTDMSTAQGFVQHELERGLDPNHVLLYWAVPVQLGISANGEVGLFPKAAPTEVDQETHEVVHAQAADDEVALEVPGGFLQSLSVSVAVEEPFVSTEDDPIEAIFVSAEEPIAEPVTAVAETVEDEIEEFAGGGDETSVEETIEVIAEEVEIAAEQTEEEFDIDVGLDDEVQEVEVEDVEEEIRGEQMIEESIVDDMKETDDDTAGILETAEAIAETLEPVAAIATEPWVSDGPIGAEFPAGRAYAKSETEFTDVSDQLQRVLKVRRWEETTEPFRGFQSPPGRF